MIKRLLLASLTLICAIAVQAQYRDIRFIYVVHDHTTPISDVTSRLQTQYNSAMSDDTGQTQAVFYMPNGSRPIVVKLNTPDDNNEDFYNKLLAEIHERNSHDVDADVDVEEIINIFNDLKLDDPTEEVELAFSFLVTPQFWEIGNNEGVIANLFYALDLANVIATRTMADGCKVPHLSFEVRYPRENPIKFNPTMPFGELNLGGINQYMNEKISPL